MFFPQWMQKITVVVPHPLAMDGLDGMTWRGLGLVRRFGPDGYAALITLFSAPSQ